MKPIPDLSPGTGHAAWTQPGMWLFSLVMHLLGLALPLALLQIYDRILPAQAYGTAVFLVLGVGVAIVLEATLRYGRHALFANLGARYEAQTTLALLARLQRADIQALEARGAPLIADGMRAVGLVRDFWSGQAGAALFELPFVLLYVGLIAYVGGWLAVIPVLLFALALVVALVWNPGIKRAAEATELAGESRRALLWNVFLGLGHLKAVGAEYGVMARWRDVNLRYLTESAWLEERMAWVRENAATMAQLSTVLIVTFGAAKVMEGALTTGALAACTMLAGRSIGPAMGSLAYVSQLARVRASEAQVMALLNLPEAPLGDQRTTTGAADLEVQGALRLIAPRFWSTPVDIAAGEIVHVHTSDTTLASRLLVAVSGMTSDPEFRVLVDGHPLSDLDARSYQRSVAWVTHQLALVPGSILDNLTLFDPRYNEQVQPWCEALGLQAYIDKLRQGMLTEVGPGAAEHIDEGMAQRIALVRALVRQPRVLLLDHAAAGIDLDGVNRLAQVLKSLGGHTTILLASFKAPLVAVCDRVLTLEPTGAPK